MWSDGHYADIVPYEVIRGIAAGTDVEAEAGVSQ